MQIKILFGSETGNAEGLALEADKKLAEAGFLTEVIDMKAIAPEKLAEYENVLLITSTWGDGDPPDNAAKLYNELKCTTSNQLSNVNYAVFAIGQSFYEHFCKTGKDFDEFLEKHGAKRLLPVELSDDDYDVLFPQWLEKVIKNLSVKK